MMNWVCSANPDNIQWLFPAMDIIHRISCSPEHLSRKRSPFLTYFDCRGHEFIQNRQVVAPLMVKKLMNMTIVYAVME
jgi:hypothetical protein